jgi:hypothetical protein
LRYPGNDGGRPLLNLGGCDAKDLDAARLQVIVANGVPFDLIPCTGPSTSTYNRADGQ